MQITIARQLGLDSSTVSNFFMNARRRSLDKWREDSPPPSYQDPMSPNSLDYTMLADDSDTGSLTGAEPETVQTISLPAGLAASAGLMNRTILVRTGNGGQATVITGTPASIIQQLNEISPELVGQLNLWHGEAENTAIDDVDAVNGGSPLITATSPSPQPAPSHTVYIIPRDRLSVGTSAGHYPTVFGNGIAGGGLVTLATASGTHQLRLEDDHEDEEEEDDSGLLGGHVVLADDQEILETEEVLADQHCIQQS